MDDEELTPFFTPEALPDVSIDRDEKRCGYWVNGDGFSFFAYFTSDGTGCFLECDAVQREGDPFRHHMSIRLGQNGTASMDVIETAIKRNLARFWPD